jgi:ABC-2 type transport system ATP-binding protein
MQNARRVHPGERTVSVQFRAGAGWGVRGACPRFRTMNAIEIRGVSKRFGEKVAVDDLSLFVDPGEFLGLLGRNGAGKSTTLKMVTGLMQPSSGSIHVLGLNVATRDLEVKRRIGVMPEDMALLDRLTGPQYLRFVGRMHGLEDAVIESRRAELFESLDLQPEPRTLLVDYSYGMKKKIALCAALLHGPEVLFLDEPFEGIDPVTSHAIRGILTRLRERGVTIVLTSHILEIVEKTCTRVAIVDAGRLCGHGTLDELRARHGGSSLEQLFLDLMGGPRAADLSWL